MTCLKLFTASLCGLIVLVSQSAARAADDAPASGARPPNIVLIMTDDQGYGDLSCHGNPQLRTPALDALYRDSVRLTNFHVDPTCSPTRSALLTGRYSSRTGVWNTYGGRSLLRKDEITLPQVLSQAGYRTGIFGKWHLGDNYPFRAMDRGFGESLVCGGGGVAQTPDHWGNDYFDDVYSHNGRPEQQTGYCTDVFFRAATKFIEDNRNRPFFTYIPTNAPHFPYNVADAYAQPFRDAGIPSPRAEFYGMIVNFDENLGRLLGRLDQLGLRDDTLVIWMTDNGTAAGIDKAGGFNAGMRGIKASEYEGGHRVPCFLRYPQGWAGGREVDRLSAHIDLLPTLLELCGVSAPSGTKVDGRSLVPLLSGRGSADWPERTLFVHSQRIETPEKWRQSAVMTDRWRLINGRELYDMQTDPAQAHDVAGEHADTVAQLRRDFDAWWDDLSTRFDEYCRIELGSPQAVAQTLTCHDWHGKLAPALQSWLANAPAINGFWAVDFVRPGTYRCTLRERPAGVVQPLKAGTARLKIGDHEWSQPVVAGSGAAVFEVDIQASPTLLQTWIESSDGSSHGAFYVDVERQ